jgi:hypothetical protein
MRYACCINASTLREKWGWQLLSKGNYSSSKCFWILKLIAIQIRVRANILIFSSWFNDFITRPNKSLFSIKSPHSSNIVIWQLIRKLSLIQHNESANSKEKFTKGTFCPRFK